MIGWLAKLQDCDKLSVSIHVYSIRASLVTAKVNQGVTRGSLLTLFTTLSTSRSIRLSLRTIEFQKLDKEPTTITEC